MPVYEYRCAGCGTDFERYLTTAGAVVTCPSCASAEVKRKLSVVTVKSGAALGPIAAPAGGGGGCCGGGCSCH